VLKVSAIPQSEDAFKSFALQLPTVNFGDCIYALMCSYPLLGIYHCPSRKQLQDLAGLKEIVHS